MLLRKLNFGVFSLYFTFIAKEKLHFSLVCRFSCCLVKEGWTPKVAWQFAIRRLVGYKQFAYEKGVEAIRQTNFFKKEKRDLKLVSVSHFLHDFRKKYFSL